MALFSQRFWLHLASLDEKVVTSHRLQREAVARLMVGRRLLTGSSLVDCWSEIKDGVRRSQLAVLKLNHFCTSRNQTG